jgi:hypothetical protein
MLDRYPHLLMFVPLWIAYLIYRRKHQSSYIGDVAAQCGLLAISIGIVSLFDSLGWLILLIGVFLGFIAIREIGAADHD